MVRAIEGNYRNGKIELARDAKALEGEPVVVLFPDSPEAAVRKVSGDERQLLLRRMFEEMDMGLDLGGKPYARREDVYDRIHRR